METKEIAEIVAEAWASIDGKSARFNACKNSEELEEEGGTYGGYLAEAEELIRRLNKRGVSVVAK